MNNWKIHFYWVIIIAVLMLISVITFWLGGKGNEIVSYVSFASALSSIILALVAIFYSMVQHTSSQQNIGEMRTLISQASHVIIEKASSMEQASVIMSRSAQLVAQTAGAGSQPSKGTFILDATRGSHLGILALYSMAQSYERRKPFSLFEVTRLYTDPTSHFIVYNYIYGFLIGFACFLEPGSLTFEITELKVNKLPSAFKGYILTHLNNRITQEVSESMKQLLENGKEKIDAYFETA